MCFCYIFQYLSMIASYRQFFLSDSTSRVRYSSGYTCQYEREKEPKGSGKQLLSNYNPHRSWLGLTEQQNLPFFEGQCGFGRVSGVKQSLRLDGRKVCSIKRVDISQAESNKATVCALPSIHLPLTREARVLAIFEGQCGKGGHGGEMLVLLKHYCFTTNTILTSTEN